MKKLLSVISILAVICSLNACRRINTGEDIAQAEASLCQTDTYLQTETETENESDILTESIEVPKPGPDAEMIPQTETAGIQTIETAKPKPPQSPYTESTEATKPVTAADEPVGINKLRPDYDLGDCRNLRGNISVILLYLNDFESSWTDDEIASFTQNEVRPGLSFLENQAQQRGVDLKLNIVQTYSPLFYDDEVIVNPKKDRLVTINAFDTAALSLNYASDKDMLECLKSQYATEVVCCAIFNKNGTSYALNPHRGYPALEAEHCLVFAYDLDSGRKDPVGSQASIIAHEILHLYGAEDYYSSPGRKTLAKQYYAADIMLGANYYIQKNNISDATAFYIGWTDTVPDLLYYEEWDK